MRFVRNRTVAKVDSIGLVVRRWIQCSARLTKILAALGIPTSSWNRPAIPEDQRRRPGPPPKSVPPEVADRVVEMDTENPWYGYQRIAVMCRRLPLAVSDEDAYVESFHSRLSNELINPEEFTSLAEARFLTVRWQLEYNHHRPHSSLNYQTPAELAPAVRLPLRLRLRSSRTPETLTPLILS